MREVIERWDTSAASCARREYERTGRRTNPYHARPEREEYWEFERRSNDDGSTTLFKRNVYRWGAEFSIGPWQKEN